MQKNIIAGHYPEESTIHGGNPLKELAPAAWIHTLFTKIKTSSPLHLQSSKPPVLHLQVFHSPSMLLKKSQGDQLHPGRILRISSPPPVLHSLNSNASHFISPVHEDRTLEIGDLDPLHGLAIQGIRETTCHFHVVRDIISPLMMV